MNRIALALALAAASVVFTGCGHHRSSMTFAHGAVTVYRDDVSIHRSGGADAQILPGGVLKIGGEALALTTEQRTAVEAYYAAATSITAHGIATGKAGADAGLTAAKEVVSGLAHGDTSQIGPRVEAKAEEVKRQALHICEDLAGMQHWQDVLAASLEAFKPYAVIADRDIHGCSEDLKDVKEVKDAKDSKDSKDSKE